MVFDIGVAAPVSPNYTPTLTLAVTGGASPSNFAFSSMLDHTSTPMNPLTYNPATGVISKTSNSPNVRESGAVVGTSANLVSSLTLTVAGLDTGDLVGYGLPSIPTCVTTRKTSVGATGSFSFSNTNLSTPATTLTTTAINSPVDSAVAFVPNPVDPVTIAETLPSSPAGWRLASASCTDANSAITGNTGAFGAQTGNSLSLTANQLHPAANITCSLTNSLLVAVDDTQSMPMDAPASSAASIFSNDTGTNISLSALNGSTCSAFPCVSTLAGGILSVSADGSYSFSPTTGFTGVVTVPYQITDTVGLTATANIVITVTPAPKLSLTKSSNGPWAVQQSGAAYNLSVSNIGTAVTSGVVTVRDNLPAGLLAATGTYSGWNCTVSGQDVTCISSAPIGVGAVSTISLPVTVSAAAVPGVTNDASVGGGGDPFNGGNPPTPGSCVAGDSHCATNTTAVSLQPGLVVLKTNSLGTVTQASLVTYTVTISNSGTTAVSGLSWSDKAASGLSDLKITGQAGDAKGSVPGLCVDLACTGITVAAGGSVSK